MELTQNVLDDLRGKCSRLQEQQNKANETMHAARLRIVSGEATDKDLKALRDARADHEALSEAVAELQREVLRVEREQAAAERDARHAAFIEMAGRELLAELEGEHAMAAEIATCYAALEASAQRIARLMCDSAQRQDAVFFAAREFGGVPQTVEVEGVSLSTAPLTQTARAGALLGLFERGEHAQVFSGPVRTVLNDVLMRLQSQRR